MWLIYLKTGPKKKGKHGMKGHIESVTFRNIVAATPSRPGPNISLKGYSPSNEIDGVTFDHVTIGGAPLQSSDIESNQYVGNVAVTP